MAFTQADLDAVNSAIASGELTIKHNGRETTYRSIADLLAAKKAIESDIALQAPASRRGGTLRYRFDTQRGDT